MELSNPYLLALLLFCCFCLEFGTAIDTIKSSQSIKDPETIISNGNAFILGFFNPQNSTNRYVGIWYNRVSVLTVVWVANRNKPIKDSSGILTIADDGNLVVVNGHREILWSSNVTNFVTNSSAQLLDSGNLVLQESTTRTIIWESFEHPCDTLLPSMKLSINLRTNQRVKTTSWRSPSDPSIGNVSNGIDIVNNIPVGILRKNGRPYWRTGPWNGQFFIGIPTMNSEYQDALYIKGKKIHDGVSLVKDNEGTYSLSFDYVNKLFLANFVLTSEGNLLQTYWDDKKEVWEVARSFVQSECDVYGMCGAFGSCDPLNSPNCSCLKGFEPKSIEEWKRRNWTSGCIRRTPLRCERMNNSSGDEGRKDGFLKLKMMKVPDFVEWSSAFKDECQNKCLENCSCVAYAYDNGIGCMLWSGTLIDLQKFSLGGTDVYIRVAYSELVKEGLLKVIITITMIIGAITITCTAYFLWRLMSKQREKEAESKEMLLFDYRNHVKLQDLPTFDLEELATATSNFHLDNKLGQGGFGPVYKGKLPDGQEIAVKKQSRVTGQGLEEFMNEVVLISKLQHRNLVRLLGCCIEGEENMLIYEYMPNKSLDTFVFDPLKQKLLDWRKRFNIIEGIGRGLLYLHRDSRLKIIHRDLKGGNILLDEELNPKISDFGIARIFGGSEDQANTRRVIGTYGYMSPEYAMQGLFSEKSDVFSFGVLILEIVSGRRNTHFYQDEQFLNLLGLAWKLWNDDNSIALVDSSISDLCFQMEMLRCIHVGLLCVQESAKDRPIVSTVISMLTSDIVDLPIPKKPAFTERQTASPSQPGQIICSNNNVTVTMVHGR